MFVSILLGLFYLGSFQLTNAQDEAFFDLGFDNPLRSIWNERQAGYYDTHSHNHISCTIEDSIKRDGVCINSASCKFQGGTSYGRRNCGLWNTCCLFKKTSNELSDARVTYFVSPDKPRSRPQPHQVHLHLMQDVCQVRVDIIRMTLEEPTLVENKVKCRDDYMFIEPASIDSNIPDICGHQKNQHFYIHLNENNHHPQGLKIGIVLNTELNTEASWDIKITQLKCPQHGDKQTKDYRPRIAYDFPLLAPRGCLQYFIERQGSFHNFGYVSKEDTTLTTGQNYAICFKRYSGTCGLSFTATYVSLRNTATNPTCTPEYIFVPDPLATTQEHCTDTTMTSLTFLTPGPYYVRFYSPETTMVTNVGNYGFSINYKITGNCKVL